METHPKSSGWYWCLHSDVLPYELAVLKGYFIKAIYADNILIKLSTANGKTCFVPFGGLKVNLVLVFDIVSNSIESWRLLVWAAGCNNNEE